MSSNLTRKMRSNVVISSKSGADSTWMTTRKNQRTCHCTEISAVFLNTETHRDERLFMNKYMWITKNIVEK